ncbi:MAG: DUF559 domain-containing protein [Devosia sp.]|uniref:endonuclease domain-containing protein n=1 Tax=Devosia sp. TaxID=1871048 RepID=UPI001AC6BE35|nr:DUF559 domain-containing protein [Devosia sp.]
MVGRASIAGLPLTPAFSPEGRGGDGAPAAQSASPLPSGERVRVRGSHGDPRILKRVRALRSAATDAEKMLWWRLRDRRLDGFKFVRQYAIGPYCADFVCRDEMLVVELDGGQHSDSVSDARRTRYLNEQGFSVLRFWNNEVLGNIDGVQQALLLTLRHCPSPDWRFAPATLSPEGRGDLTATSVKDR